MIITVDALSKQIVNLNVPNVKKKPNWSSINYQQPLLGLNNLHDNFKISPGVSLQWFGSSSMPYLIKAGMMAS